LVPASRPESCKPSGRHDGSERGRYTGAAGIQSTPTGAGAGLLQLDGVHFGGHAGGLWARKEWTVRDPAFPSFLGQSDGSHRVDGWLGGVQAGCDYQFAGGFVIGVAGDYAWTDADGSHFSPLFPGSVNHTQIDSLSSVTGRLGYAWDRFLGYVKGGGAWERDQHDFVDGILIGSVTNTRTGWTVGVGGEYAFTNFVTGFIEYNTTTSITVT
jgi:outer membrane immunogenic protein